MNTYSIITNYGCHFECPYCVVKENNLQIPRTVNSKVEETVKELIQHEKIDVLSLSGGGDPCYKMNKARMHFYISLAVLARKNNIKFELHTSYINTDLKSLFKTIVYHVINIEDISKIRKFNKETVRVVFVVQEHFTEDYVNEIAKKIKRSKNIDELSFRQRIDNEYNTTYHLHDFLKSGHQKDWYYIEQDDYNKYIVNDKIYTKYSDIK